MSEPTLVAVGDVHGCLKPLKTLIKMIDKAFSNTRIIFLGDYIDRGNHSMQTVNYLMKLSRERDIICLMGNHERAFCEVAAGADYLIEWLNPKNFGGVSTLESYGFKIDPNRKSVENEARVFIENNDTIQEHLEWMSKLPLYHETNRHLMVHAGIAPGKPLSQQIENDLLWTKRSWYREYSGLPKTIVYGHTPREKPLVLEGSIGIDTGCVFGGYLSAVALLDKPSFISVANVKSK